MIQVGANNEKPYPGCIHLMGQTTLSQVFYLIKNSCGLLSTDTFTQHVADAFNIKSVIIVGNNYKDNIKGYFNPKNQIAIEPPYENGQKPCLSLQDPLKMIDKIKPEQIAKAFCELLNLDYDFPYETLYMGEIYITPMVISVCDSVINPQQLGLNQMIMDMTCNFNEQVLVNQLNVCDCAILTNKPVNLDIIKSFKPRVKELVYMIDDLAYSSPEFVKEIQKLGIPVRVLCDLDQNTINNLKLDWLDVAILIKKPTFDVSKIKEFENIDVNKLYFKSAKFYLGRNKLYPSQLHYKLDRPIPGFDVVTPTINEKEFWNSLDSYRILSKIA